MISVCMATYNGEKYLREQVDSILVQLESGDELIVSDDYSSDRTLDILRGYNDSRIKIFMNDYLKGVTGNFENALRHASGDIIFLSDQDDIWLENKVALFKDALKQADLVLSDCMVVDSDKQIIVPSKFKAENVKVGVWHNLYKSGYLGCCMAFKRDVLAWSLPFPPKHVLHDIWIGLTAGIKGRFILLDEPTLMYRRHSSTVTSTSKSLFKNRKGSGNGNSLWYKLKYRGVILFQLVKWRIKM